MAYTERYVTQAASGGGDGSSGSPWTLAEAFGVGGAAAGDRVNIQSDGAYSTGAITYATNGSPTAPIMVRGYNSTIGDLVDQGRTDDGPLDTTNFPQITVTGNQIPGTHYIFQNLRFLNTAHDERIFRSSSMDNVAFVSCDFLTSNSNASAGCILLDNYITLIQCDLECSGASHTAVFSGDNVCRAFDCRFKGVADTTLFNTITFLAVGCVFIGGGSVGRGIDCSSNTTPNTAINCTFYDLDEAIYLPNAAGNIPVLVANCHVTDCASFLYNPYTSDMYSLEIHNRTRDNTTPRTSIVEGVLLGEVTTDTGGPATDYEDESTDDLRLIAAAPGVKAGLKANRDIGAHQHDDPAGGSGGVTKLAGVGGGLVG